MNNMNSHEWNHMLIIVIKNCSRCISSSKDKKWTGQRDMYVDGGLLCNYPVHVFDGKIYKKN